MLTAFRFAFLLAVAALIARPAAAQPSGPDGNLPMPAPELQRRMQNEPFEVVDVGQTHGGIMTTEKVTMVFPDGTKVKAKWKAAPSEGEGWNNSPRRELAAYTVQQLFLDPDDYIVPPVAVRCIPLDDYGPISKAASPTLPHTKCVLGTLSAWLENVQEPDKSWDPKRFAQDPRFAYHFANLNILTDLIKHRDAKRSNFLISTDALNPQIFSVDNGISFDAVYNFFTWHFDQIRVGSLPQQTIARLQQVKPEQLERLAVLLELQPDADGILRPAPATPGTNRAEGVRMVGNGIQFGLTTEEIAAINQRMQALLADVRDGKEHVF
jgi:hypothetical protein